MSAEQNVSGPTTTSASAYPSTSLPPDSSSDPASSTTNGAQTENGTHSSNLVAGSPPSDSRSDPVDSIGTNIPPNSTAFHANKLPSSNGQTRKNPAHNDQTPISFVDNADLTSPQQQQLNNDHSADFLPASNDGLEHANEQTSANTTPPNAYKAQITTTSLKPNKNLNGGDKTPTQTNDHVEPSTSTTSATSAKSTPKTSQPRNRTPARNRQKAGEAKTPRSGGQNSANNSSNASGQAVTTTGTKRPHPNQYAYQSTAPKDSRSAPSYPSRYNSVAVPAGSTQVHHGAQQVQYSIPASNSYSHIYVQSQGPSTASSPYALHQRSGTATLSQRTNVPAGSSSPQLIIQCRPDQQPYSSQGQASNQHFIIQTQQASDQPTVYQQRPGVSGRPEIQRQYIQTIPNGPPSQTSTGQGQQTGQPQVLHIQLHHGEGSGQKLVIQPQPPTSAVQQHLIDKRQIPNGPQQQTIVSDSQLLSTLADRQGPSSSSAIVHQHHLPSTAQQQLQRSKNVRTLLSQPPMSIKSDDMFDEMHPAHLPLPDSFNTILDQIHASGESPKTFYRRLKKQFKYLVYENECYQEELRNSQRHLLKLSRDKNFLLDRLLNYESAEEASDDSDADSDATIEEKPKPKKKKTQPPRKRNPAPSTSKKASAKTMPKPEDENSQCSVDSALANSQGNSLPPTTQFSAASSDSKA